MDQIDEDIIQVVDSGTIRYSSMSKKLNIPLSTVHFRIKRLEREHIIRYYKGEIDWKKAGLPLTALIFINIDVDMLKRIRKSQEKLLKELLDIGCVKEGYLITGDEDIMIRVIAKDTEHLKSILLNQIDSKEGIVKTKTIITLD